MVVTIRSLGLNGIAGYEVKAECFLSGGLPAFDVVGLPDAAVREARERVRAAVKNCGARFPVSRITVNLAPAGQKKAGTLYDLPIFVGILAAAGELPPPPEHAAFLGELSLTGALRGVSGVLPMALAAREAGIQTLFVPAENAAVRIHVRTGEFPLEQLFEVIRLPDRHLEEKLFPVIGVIFYGLPGQPLGDAYAQHGEAEDRPAGEQGDPSNLRSHCHTSPSER